MNRGLLLFPNQVLKGLEYYAYELIAGFATGFGCTLSLTVRQRNCILIALIGGIIGALLAHVVFQRSSY